MAVYAEVKGDQLVRFPYTQGSLMEENPFTNYGPDPDLAAVFPSTETAIKNGYALAEVTYAAEPSYDPATQVCAQDTEPKKIGGVWTLGWTVSPMTPEQKAAYDAGQKAANKSRAMTLLQETDWTEIPSVSDTGLTPHLVNISQFIAYRTSLRAIAVNPPVVAAWPTKPAEQWSN